MKSSSPLCQQLLPALALTLIVGGLGFATPAKAEATTHLSVDYQVALGGFDFGHVGVQAQVTDTTYQLEAIIKTEGIAEQFFETTFALESQGVFSGNRVKPARFVSTYTEPDSSRRVELRYPHGRAPVMTANPAYEDGFGPNIGANDVLMTQDPISALLLPTTNASPCNRTLPLFDGRRRYDLHLTPDTRPGSRDGMTEMSGPEGSYSGPVLRCNVKMIPVAGYERKTLIKLLERDDSIKVWLAPVDDGRFWVPVRLTLRTPFGGAVMRASRFEVLTSISAPVIPTLCGNCSP